MPIETINLSEPKYAHYLRVFAKQDWVLCLGAGICKGILPDWFELTLRLVNSTFKTKWTDKEFKEITNTVGFSLDS
jgi:ferredoxin